MVKLFRVIGTSAVLLLLGWTVPAFAGQEPKDQPKEQEKQHEEKPAKQDQQHQQKQQQHQQQDNSKKQEQQQAKAQQDQHQRQDNKSAQRQSPAEAHQQQTAWQSDRAHSWQSEHRTWQQRGGYNGYHVPDDRFRSFYGQNHGFRIYSLPVRIVDGNRRFQYGGYWFSLVDPWPEYWSNDWYDSDDVYVDYFGDGYYLCNRRYPRDRIAITFYIS